MLDGAEAMCVVNELIDGGYDGWSVPEDECRGLSLLDAAQHQSLLQCLTCWQQQYSPHKV